MEASFRELRAEVRGEVKRVFSVLEVLSSNVDTFVKNSKQTPMKWHQIAGLVVAVMVATGSFLAYFASLSMEPLRKDVKYLHEQINELKAEHRTK